MTLSKYKKRGLTKFKCLYCGKVKMGRKGKLYCCLDCITKDYKKVIEPKVILQKSL